MKKICLIVCFLFLYCAIFSQQYRIKYSNDGSEPLSLENVIRLALENSYELLLLEQELVISEQREKEATFLYFPQFSVNASATGYHADSPFILPENTGMRLITPKDKHEKEDLFFGVGISATQYLYTGGKNSSTVAMARTANKETQTRYEAAKGGVIYKSKKAVYNYLFALKKDSLAKQVLEVAKEKSAKKNKTSVEKIIVASEIASFESEVARAEEELKKAKISLLRTLNKELNAEVSVDTPFEFDPIEVDLNKLILWAMEFRPEVKNAMYKLEMDNIAVKLSLMRRYPDILLGASYDRQGEKNLNDENMQVTLAMRLPLGYDFGTQVKQKRAEQRQTVLRQASIEDSVRTQVLEAYNNLMFWQNETPKLINIWDSVNDNVKDFYKGKPSLSDIFVALNYYYKTGIKCIEAKKEHLLAISTLEYAVGKDIR